MKLKAAPVYTRGNIFLVQYSIKMFSYKRNIDDWCLNQG